MEIIPGIYKIRQVLPAMTANAPLGKGVRSVNVYLVEGNAEWMLIDAGWPDERSVEALRKALIGVGISFEQISKVVFTHVHLDHFGLGGRLRELSGAKLYIHQMEKRFILPRGAEVLQLFERMKEWLHENGNHVKDLVMPEHLPQEQMIFVSPTFPDAIWFSGKIGFPDVFLKGGERIGTDLFNFEVIWTPGHSPGHICLYEREKKILICGDHILSHITTSIPLNPLSRSNPLGDYISSLNVLKELDVELVLPGHGKHFNGFHERVEELILHHEERKQAILEVVGQEPKTAYDIASDVPWVTVEGGVSWEDLGLWHQRLALMETLAHLKVLEEKGVVKKMRSDGLKFYCR